MSFYVDTAYLQHSIPYMCMFYIKSCAQLKKNNKERIFLTSLGVKKSIYLDDQIKKIIHEYIFIGSDSQSHTLPLSFYMLHAMVPWGAHIHHRATSNVRKLQISNR